MFSIIPCLCHCGCYNVFRDCQVFHGEQKPSQLRMTNYTPSTIWKLIGFILICRHLVNIFWSRSIIGDLVRFCLLCLIHVNNDDTSKKWAQWKVFKCGYLVHIFDAHILTLQALIVKILRILRECDSWAITTANFGDSLSLWKCADLLYLGYKLMNGLLILLLERITMPMLPLLTFLQLQQVESSQYCLCIKNNFALVWAFAS